MATKQLLGPQRQRPNIFGDELANILPHRGFLFQKGRKVFQANPDQILLQQAIEGLAPGLEKGKIDAALAAIIIDAISITRHSKKFHKFLIKDVHTILKAACKKHTWTKAAPNPLFPRLMGELIRARFAYKQLTQAIGRPEEDEDEGEEGKLARAIDDWIKVRPIKNTGTTYAQTPQHRVETVADTMAQDDKEYDDAYTANTIDTELWGSDVTDGYDSDISETDTDKEQNESSEDDDTPWKHITYESVLESIAKSTGGPGDENAPWVPWAYRMYARQVVYGRKRP